MEKKISRKKIIELLNRCPLGLYAGPNIHPHHKIETVWAHMECFMNYVNNANLPNLKQISEYQEKALARLYNNLSKFDSVDDISSDKFDKLLLKACCDIVDFYDGIGTIDKNQEIDGSEIYPIIWYIRKLHKQLLRYYSDRYSLWISYEDKDDGLPTF